MKRIYYSILGFFALIIVSFILFLASIGAEIVMMFINDWLAY